MRIALALGLALAASLVACGGHETGSGSSTNGSAVDRRYPACANLPGTCPVPSLGGSNSSSADAGPDTGVPPGGW
jgi:hypothetical protein